MENTDQQNQTQPENNINNTESQSKQPELSVSQQPNNLNQRFVEVRGDAKKVVESINSLFDEVENTDTSTEEPVNNDPNLHSEIQHLTSEVDMDPDTFIRESSVIISKASALSKKLSSESNDIMMAWISKKNNYIIDRRLQQLEDAHGIGRLSAFFEKRRLLKEKTRNENDASVLNEKGINIEGQNDLLVKEKKTLEEKRDEVVTQRVSSAITEIVTNYESLAQELVANESLSGEIRGLYIEKVILPELERVVHERNLSDDTRNHFLKTLTEILENRNTSHESPRNNQNLCMSILYENGGGYDYQLEDLLRPLTEQNLDIEVVRNLVANFAIKDIQNLIQSGNKYFEHNGNYFGGQTFENICNQAITSSDSNSTHNLDNSFREMLYSNRYQDSNANNVAVYMPFWQIVRDAPLTNEMFGDIIKEIDQSNYLAILRQSLSGSGVEKLQYYLTPDSIRNLVLLTVSEYHNDDTAHYVLRRLSENPNFEDLMSNAEDKHPALKNIHDILRTWGEHEDYNNSNLRDRVGALALDTLNNAAGDQKLITVALEAINNKSLADFLIQRGISREKVEQIFNAVDYLSKASYEAPTSSINDFYFIREFKGVVYNMLIDPSMNSESLTSFDNYYLLSDAILKNKSNFLALEYLSNSIVIQKLATLNSNEAVQFLEAYKTCPALSPKTDGYVNAFLMEFCKQYTGPETTVIFEKMSEAYAGNDAGLREVIALVGENRLTTERAIELSSKVGEFMGENEFGLASEFPEVFLATDDGLILLRQIVDGRIFNLDQALDERFGRLLTQSPDADKLMIRLFSRELARINETLKSGNSIEINDGNWRQLFLAYLKSYDENQFSRELSPESISRIKTMFNNVDMKNFCLESLRNQWISYLDSGNFQNIPLSLKLVTAAIGRYGITNMSQMESLNRMINTVDNVINRNTTVERTRQEIISGMVLMENRFIKEKWSNEDRSDFYNISSEIMNASPSIFSDYLSLFDDLSPSQLKTFTNEIYPLYRAKLTLMEQRDDKFKEKFFKRENLMSLRTDVRNFREMFKGNGQSFENKKRQLSSEIKDIFATRFGITKVPEEFNSENIRSLVDLSMYLSNLHNRNIDRETILGFYLALSINGKWSNFRNGETINPSEYLIPGKAMLINELLEERKSLNPLNAERLGIQESEIPEFITLLQRETQNVMLGNVETIDVKLNSVLSSLQNIEDPDLYTDPMDKQRLQLILNWGNKIGPVVAKMQQSLIHPERSLVFTDEEQLIQNQIIESLKSVNIELSPQTLKENFQDGLKPFAIVIKLLNLVRESNVSSEIQRLRNSLNPPERVIEIFRQLGEDFKPSSGALALSQDLNYLDNLVVKREDELGANEKQTIIDYTSSIRAQMLNLEGVYANIRKIFGGASQMNTFSSNPLLQRKLEEINKIVNTESTQQIITTTVTNDLNVIIENMRECLSCKTEGCNNDTDLTFGDINKFYIYSQSESRPHGSISDEIAFFEPITRSDGNRLMAFVLDKVYESNTPTIMENNILAIMKKITSLRQRFPNAKLGVFVSDLALITTSSGISNVQNLLNSLNMDVLQESVSVDIVPSAMGDHYTEFGCKGDVNARTTGQRTVGGIMITPK